MRHLVDVGGAELEAVLEGQGSLTVVFENGLATPLEFENWTVSASVDPSAAIGVRTI